MCPVPFWPKFFFRAARLQFLCFKCSGILDRNSISSDQNINFLWRAWTSFFVVQALLFFSQEKKITFDFFDLIKKFPALRKKNETNGRTDEQTEPENAFLKEICWLTFSHRYVLSRSLRASKRFQIWTELLFGPFCFVSLERFITLDTSRLLTKLFKLPTDTRIGLKFVETRAV